ncbi:MAG: Wzz/FepE/Etk N-terminal domain-containing protein, partial [Deltaproteobacteria bacterium]|nr:Wzz/FepE/Etk N-terminal domain-containing protein [Deltaproteobacteria bacterium]
MVKTEMKGSSFRDFLRIIFLRRSIILSTFLAVTLLVLAVNWIIPPKYETAAKILARERKAESVLQDKYDSDYRSERVAFLQSQIEIIRSEEVVRRVFAQLFPASQEFSAQQIKSFRQSVKVLSPKGYDITNSDILLIQVTGRNPVRAAEAANRLTREFINYTCELKGRTAKQTGDFLEKQSQAHLEKMKQAEEQVKNFEGRPGPESTFLIATVKTKGPNPELITFNTNYLTARTALKETEFYLIRLREMVPKGVISQKLVRENPVLATIKNHIVKLEIQLSALRSQYPDQSAKNMRILKEIDQNKQLFNQEIKADIDGRFVDMAALEARVKILRETVDRYTALAQKQYEYARRYRNYEILEEGYQDLLRDIQKARFTEAMNTYRLAHIDIIDEARVPKSPVSPNMIKNTLMGMLMGILLGLGLGFFLNYFDH